MRVKGELKELFTLDDLYRPIIPKKFAALICPIHAAYPSSLIEKDISISRNVIRLTKVIVLKKDESGFTLLFMRS